ncbi:YhgN family NAAT transporter [Buchnera aphidicola (Ceratoglyphina bambusae)]|uniref:YhgN family NAAT transporter n=1 Tax=Buchnera aphidicola TaxID=9 RepID=UPI0031B875DF
MNKIISNTILLILIMDPLGNLPIFMSILKKFGDKRKKIILIREMLIALMIMILFLFTGEKILSFLNLKTQVVSISGGIILFLIAIKMIFSSGNNNFEESITKEKEPFLVPLAIPLIAGPSILATLMLISHQNPNQMLMLIISLILAWSFSLIILLSTEIFINLFGENAVNALEKLMGLILIMLSTQMFLDGIKLWFKT